MALPLCLVLLTPLLAAQQREVRAMRVDSDVAIRIWIPAGMVEVEGWDHDSIEVRATAAKGTRFGGGGTAAAMKFSLENLRTNDTLLPSAQMRVFVPRGARLWIKSTVAGVTARGLTGELDVLQVGGSTMVVDTRGVITVESIDGQVDLRRLEGVVRLRGGAGRASLDGISGSLDASLVSGAVAISGPAAGRGPLQGRVETVSGTVWFSGALGPLGRLEISTHDGSIGLMLRGDRPPLVQVVGGSAELDPRLDSGHRAAGTFVLRTFKGAINARFMAGI
jgi:hypothetical protein